MYGWQILLPCQQFWSVMTVYKRQRKCGLWNQAVWKQWKHAGVHGNLTLVWMTTVIRSVKWAAETHLAPSQMDYFNAELNAEGDFTSAYLLKSHTLWTSVWIKLRMLKNWFGIFRQIIKLFFGLVVEFLVELVEKINSTSVSVCLVPCRCSNSTLMHLAADLLIA